MLKVTRDVTREYEQAKIAAEKFNPGEQANIGALMRAAYTHGYAQALIDRTLPPEGCHCPPEKCMAPVIMGRQMPCLRAENKAGESR